jgi:hypothetical protein
MPRMGVFDKLADKMSKKAEDKAVDVAKERIAKSVKSKFEKAKDALFGEDDPAPDKELEGKTAEEKEKILEARAEDAKKTEAEREAAIEAKRARIAALKKEIAAERAAIKAEELRQYQAKKAQDSRAVDDELAALKRKLGK